MSNLSAEIFHRSLALTAQVEGSKAVLNNLLARLPKQAKKGMASVISFIEAAQESLRRAGNSNGFEEIIDAEKHVERGEAMVVELLDLLAEVAIAVADASVRLNPMKWTIRRVFGLWGYDPFRPVRARADEIAARYEFDWKRCGMLNRHDWDAIERDYRTGQFSNRELSAKHGVSHVSIGKRARKYGWRQDLSEDVRRETRARLIDDAARGVTSGVTTGNQGSQEAVRKAGEATAEIIISHRRQIDRMRNVAERQLDLIDQMLNGDEKAKTKAMERLCLSKGDGMAVHLRTAIELVERVIRLERRAWGLDDEERREDLDRAESLRADLQRKLAQVSGS